MPLFKAKSFAKSVRLGKAERNNFGSGSGQRAAEGEKCANDFLSRLVSFS